MGWEIRDLDVLLVPLGFLVLSGYHAYYLYTLRNHPTQTLLGINLAGRRAWVYQMMKDNDKTSVVAVQSLRNSMMGSILWATVAVLLCSASVAFINTPYVYGEKKLDSYVIGSHDNGVLSAKVTSLLFCFMICFFCCMQSVRYLNQVSYLINIPPEGILRKLLTPEYIGDIFVKATNFQAIGARSFYFTIPLLLWIMGPIPVFMSCFAMVPFLYQLDMAK